jgi:hypothetical protein
MLYKVVLMPEFDCTSRFESLNQNIDQESFAPDDDLLMEQILENLNSTPIGQVLKQIASLPEVRQNKILNVRRQITDGKYDLTERVDAALDKVLEDLTM